MPKIIKNRQIVDDDFVLLADPDAWPAVATNMGPPLILPLALCEKHPDLLADAGQRIGVWLGPDASPETVQPLLAHVALVAVNFPNFTDGRGYSLGRLIRQRYGFAGELRAVGDVLRDQIYFLDQCGFNAFALRADQNIDEALAALADYSWLPAVTRQRYAE